MTYKIKLQKGDHLKIADITKNQYQDVIDRFYSDSGLPRTVNDYFDYAIDVSDYEFIGWASNNIIDVGDENNMDGRLLTYAEIMEQEQMSNEWFEKGELPPVGFECEYSAKDPQCWIKCKPLFFGKTQCVVFDFKQNREFSGFIENALFRPIRTERDRAIKAALSDKFCFSSEQNDARIKKLLGDWFDAGLLRAPEDK